MEPTVYQVEGKYFGQTERWPTKYTQREGAEVEAGLLRGQSQYWGWIFTVEETFTDA